MNNPIESRNISRREFLVLSGTSAAALLSGCATNPVTGRSQLILLGEDEEIRLDRQSAPHQFSADFGAIQDAALNEYIGSVGHKLASLSHRPGMPYSFRGVNAVYANAYAFPAGSIAATRGILLNLEAEAELAALLGHEIGHVCYRHAAARAGKSLLAAAAVGTLTLLIGSQYEEYEALTAGLGTIASGALLARYSRANEREADAIGLKYMTAAGYPPSGMIALMDVLRKLSKDKPGVIELMFSTHPMSEERYQTASKEADTQYKWAADFPSDRERYMDHTAGLRAMKGAIDLMQRAQEAMGSNKLDSAIAYLNDALRQAPDDYAGLLMLARCRLSRKEWSEAERRAEEAKSIYPGEAQVYQVAGMAKVYNRRCEAAYTDFKRYEDMLPGNPNTTYFKGLSLDCMGRREPAAREYMAYLEEVNEGEYAQHAYKRLVEWGYIK